MLIGVVQTEDERQRSAGYGANQSATDGELADRAGGRSIVFDSSSASCCTLDMICADRNLKWSRATCEVRHRLARSICMEASDSRNEMYCFASFMKSLGVRAVMSKRQGLVVAGMYACSISSRITFANVPESPKDETEASRRFVLRGKPIGERGM